MLSLGCWHLFLVREGGWYCISQVICLGGISLHNPTPYPGLGLEEVSPPTQRKFRLLWE